MGPKPGEDAGEAPGHGPVDGGVLAAAAASTSGSSREPLVSSGARSMSPVWCYRPTGRLTEGVRPHGVPPDRLGHSMEVHQGDESGEDPSSEGTRPERSPIDRRFAAIIGALHKADPRFARRVSEPHRLRSGQIMMLAGLVATLLVGVLPLAVGLQTQLAALLTVGAIGIAFSPVIVPALVGVVLGRVRPAW